MASPTPGSISVAASTPVIYGGRGGVVGPSTPYQIAPNGIWTWFTSPVAVFHNNSTYVGFLTNSGYPGVARYNHSTDAATQQVWNDYFLEVDDHNNAAIQILTDGRIAAMYSMHSDYQGFRYRISTSPGDITSWASEVRYNPALAYVTYSNLQYLSTPGRYYNVYRDTGTVRRMVSTADFATWDAPRRFIERVTGDNRNSYHKQVGNGVNRIDTVFTDISPNEGALPRPASIFHAYITVDAANVATTYNSAGVSQGTGGITNLNATKILDGVTGPNAPYWVWDITYGAGGEPQILIVGLANLDDHVYMHGRWNGSAWVITDICNAGGGLYPSNRFYSGGACFDSQDASKIYLSRQVGSAWEIQEWRTLNNGASWSKHRDITSGSAPGIKNARPMSPRNHDGRAAVVWWSGTYTDFYTYNTAVMAVGAAA